MTRDARLSSVGAAAKAELWARLNNVPAELRSRRQWVGYRLISSRTRPGKSDKIPVDPHTGANASTSDPATWATFEEALAAAKHTNLAGVGYVFAKDDPYTGVDLDGCIDDAGEPAPWALGVIGRLDSYTERSQSGKGLHVILRASLPPGGRKKGAVEMYDSSRFFAITGDIYLGLHLIGDRQLVIEELHAEVFGAPEPVRQPTQPAHPVTAANAVADAAAAAAADADLIAKAQNARNGGAFSALWQGSTTGYTSHSEADLALAGKLLFWTNGDVNRADALFRQSGLFREKWDQRHYGNGATYGEATLRRALSGMTEFYSGNGHGPSTFPSYAAPLADALPERPDMLPSEPEWMQSAPVAEPDTPPAQPVPIPESNEGTPALQQEHLTDLGNARRLVAQHGDVLRYCHPWRKWLTWDGRRWTVDSTGAAERCAKQTVKAIYAEAGNAADEESRKALAKHALRCEAAQRIRAMLELATSEAGIPLLPDALDADPWLLNVQNGTLDLRTGQLLPHDRRNLITKLVPAAYDPAATCPIWERFLLEIMDGNSDLVSFLQRTIGYALTGDTSEQVIFILYGMGSNGKTVLLETLRDLLGGDYTVQLRSESLMVKWGDTIPNDIARLKGARLVSARESEQGKRLAESLIKEMSGGDTMTARFLHGEYFDFRPQFKLFLATNHKPVIRGTDKGIWRRVRLVPFTVTFEGAKKDAQLARKLRQEWPGILAWTVRGCLEWQRNGIDAPLAVTTATEDYRAESDPLAAFLAERTIEDASCEVQAKPLYEAYRHWCDESGEKADSHTIFGLHMKERRAHRVDSRTRLTWYSGLRLTQF